MNHQCVWYVLVGRDSEPDLLPVWRISTMQTEAEARKHLENLGYTVIKIQKTHPGHKHKQGHSHE